MIGSHGKLTEEKAQIIKQLLSTGEYTHQEIANFFGVSRGLITKINLGKRWNDEQRSFEMRTPRSNDFRDFGDEVPKTRERKPEKTLYRYTNVIGRNEEVKSPKTDNIKLEIDSMLKEHFNNNSDVKSITINFG